MKKTFTLFMLLIIANVMLAQPRPAAKSAMPGSSPAAPTKPKVNPYVLKKDYDEMLLNMESKIKMATSQNAGLRNEIGSKEKKIEALNTQMAKVEEILNSTAFKISNTEDSLSKTRFSVEEFRRNTEEKFTTEDAIIQKDEKMASMMFYGCLVLTAILFLLLLLQNARLKKSILNHNIQAEIKLKETANEVTKKMEEELETQRAFLLSENSSLGNKISRNMSEEKERLNFELEKLNSELANLKNNI